MRPVGLREPHVTNLPSAGFVSTQRAWFRALPRMAASETLLLLTADPVFTKGRVLYLQPTGLAEIRGAFPR